MVPKAGLEPAHLAAVDLNQLRLPISPLRHRSSMRKTSALYLATTLTQYLSCIQLFKCLKKRRRRGKKHLREYFINNYRL